MNILTVAQAADYLQVSVDTLYPMIQNGTVPAAKVKGQWRLVQDDLLHWLRGQYEAQKGASCHTKDQERLSGGSLSAACVKALEPKAKKTQKHLRRG